MRGEPTWFGPERSRLFGVVHSPEGGTARAGVIICPPLGRQHLYSYRGLKLLAQELCAKGFAVLRFDYPGTGDSTGAQSRDSAVADFVEGIRTAVEYMRSAGVERVSLVGVRAGALLAAVAAESLVGLECLVLWDPVTDGRRYLREQQSLYRVTVSEGGPDELPDEVGAVQLLGMPLSSAAAAELSALKMPSTIATLRVLVLTRPENAGDRRLAGLCDMPTCDAQVISGQSEFLEPRSVFFRIPTDTVAGIEKWLDATSASDMVAFRPDVVGSTVVEVLPDGREIIESFAELGPDRLFAIRTAIVGTGADGPTVLIHNTACEHRVGSGRIWPDSARELATLGVNVVRYDRRGVGETGVANDQYTGIHSATAQSDVTAAVHALAVPPRRLMMTGICSGAWNSAFAGSHYGARLVVLLNLLLYSWRRVDGVAERFAYMAEASDDPPPQRPTWEAVKEWLRDDLPYPGWLLLGHLGYTQAPEVLMRPLIKKGVRTELVLSPSDYEWYRAHRGPIGLSRLARRGSAPKLTVVPGGDHAVLHRGLQIFMRNYLVDAARREFSGPL